MLKTVSASTVSFVADLRRGPLRATEQGLKFHRLLLFSREIDRETLGPSLPTQSFRSANILGNPGTNTAATRQPEDRALVRLAKTERPFDGEVQVQRI